MLDLVAEFRELVSRLQEAGVDFAVCGGLAMAVHGRTRATLDVDLLVPGDQLEMARGVAREVGYTFDAGRLVIRRGEIEMHRLSKEDPETHDLLSLDLLVVTPPLESAWASREHVEWAYGSIPVVTREGLVAMKRLRGSGQDQDDIRLLEERNED